MKEKSPRVKTQSIHKFNFYIISGVASCGTKMLSIFQLVALTLGASPSKVLLVHEFEIKGLIINFFLFSCCLRFCTARLRVDKNVEV